MSLAEAFAVGEAYNRAVVEAQTWGHLAPEAGRAYAGTMLIGYGCYGSDGLVPLRVQFNDLSSSPWFYDDLCTWLLDQYEDTGEGVVYRWSGTYRKFKNGKFRFTGRLAPVDI